MFSRTRWPVVLPPLLFLASVWLPSPARGALTTEQVPAFKLRARVTPAKPESKFVFRFEVPGASANTTGEEWSAWLRFERPQIEATLKGYPALYMNGFPVVVKLHVDGVVGPTVVEAELKFDEPA